MEARWDCVTGACWRHHWLALVKCMLTGKVDIARLAAAYAWVIVRNHPFVDGNKRAALVACRVFLRLNGYDLFASAEEKYGIFMDIASGKVSEEQLTDWIRRRLVPAS